MRVVSLVAVVLGLLALPAPAVYAAAGVVGDGTAAGCTEAALDAALAAYDEITFACGPDPVTIPITTTKMIGSVIALDGGDLVTLDAGANAINVFAVNRDGSLRLGHLTVAGGGGIFSQGALTLDTVTVRDSSSHGVMLDLGATAQISNSTLSANELSGLNVYSGIVHISDSSFEANLRGGIENDGEVTAERIVVTGNEVSGAPNIVNYGQMTLRDSRVSDNNTGLDAGGIFTCGTLLIEDSLIARNSSGRSAGGLHQERNGSWACDDTIQTTIRDSTFAENVGGRHGGGVYASHGSMTIERTVFDANEAVSTGGGLVAGYAHLVVRDSTFVGNYGVQGGGMALFTEQPGVSPIESYIVERTLLSGNPAANGGALYVSGPQQVRVVNSTMAGNGSTDIVRGGNLSIEYSTIVGDRLRIEDTGTLALVGTIIAGGCDSNGTIVSNGHNLAIDESCGLEGAGDQVVDDVMLGPLQDNGGLTATHELLPGSPAIDAGDNGSCPAVDGRAFARPHDGDGDGTATCDVGAVETASMPGDIDDPVTTIVIDPEPNETGWTAAAATVTLTATDNTSVAQVCYEATGATTLSECVAGDSATVNLSAEGETSLSYYAVDATGNSEAAQETTIGVDLTDPTVSATFSPGPNAAGWNRAGTIMSLAASDGAAGSGIAQLCYEATGAQPIPTTCEDESSLSAAIVNRGVTTVTWWVVDDAGRESGVESHEVKIDRDNPVVTSGPTPSLGVGTRGKYSDVVPVPITWASEDPADGSGVDMHALQYTTDGGASWRGVATDPDPKVTTVVANLFPGLTYQFRAAARDASGRWGAYTVGPEFQLTLVDGVPSADVEYLGTWADLRLWGSYGGMTRWSVDPNATVTFSFTGSEVAWVASYGRSRGIAEVYLDGATTPIATIDLYAPIESSRVVVFSHDFESAGAHTITVRVTWTRNPASTGVRVDADAFIVIS